MAEVVRRRGYFSILKWRDNPTRDEARNIAVLLVDPEGEFAGIRRAPPSALSTRLAQQGLIDDVLEGLKERFEGEEPPNLADLNDMRTTFVNSIAISDPKPVVVKDLDKTLKALYKAYVQKTTSYGGKPITKSALRSDVTQQLRRKGYKVALDHYVDDFRFDVVVEDPQSRGQTAAEVLSFANPKKTWTREEDGAGHFLFAIRYTNLEPLAIVQPPTEVSLDIAIATFERVSRWFRNEKVEVVSLEDVVNGRFPSRI